MSSKSAGFGSTSTSSFGLPRKYSGGGLGSTGLGSTGFSSSSRSYDYEEPYDSVNSFCNLIRISCLLLWIDVHRGVPLSVIWGRLALSRRFA